MQITYYKCDRCGKDNRLMPNIFRYKSIKINLLSGPPIFDGDLCDGCYMELELTLQQFFKQGEFADKPPDGQEKKG